MMNPHYTTPPKWPLNFLRWFCSPELLEDVEGDLCELFHQRLERPKRAQILFAIDVLLLFRPGIIKNFTIIQNSNNNIMIRNHVKTAFRHFLRYKSYALINIAGLTVGIASSLLIFLWVNDEVNKDKFHKNDTTLYSIMRNMHQDDGSIRTTSTVPQPLEILLEEEYPEVGQVSLISWPHEFLLQKNGDPFREVGRYVSPEFLEIFSFNLLTGDNKTALNDISSIVISRDMAEKHFGSVEKSMGQSVKIDNAKDFIVTGVFENVSNQSSLKFEWLVSAWEFIERNDWVENWSNGGFSMVVNLQDNVNVYDFNAKIEQEINVHDNEEADERLFVQKYSDGYLYSTFKNGVNTGGRIEYVRILTIVAIFLLVIACINFMNLSKVRASKRAPEIGVRKVVGANKGGLRIQLIQAITRRKIAT
ncbi:MAG: ABC transporter permease, partial [Bacteroidota bacterium]